MSEEPRRSGRATKGQHKGSPSPAPQKNVSTKASKAKGTKKKPAKEVEQEEDESEVIRCICGNTDGNDKRTFIGCDTCEVWQHNVCMGLDDDDDKQPDNYFCEQCAPDDHQETIQALEDGRPIWEERNKIWKNEKKMSKSRKGKSGGEVKPGWLKKDVPPRKTKVEDEQMEDVEETVEEEQKELEPEPEPEPEPATEQTPEDAKPTKRKRASVTEDRDEGNEDAKHQSKRGGAGKRRKSSTQTTTPAAEDPATSMVPISALPAERQKAAEALLKTISDDISQRQKEGYKLPQGRDVKGLAEHHAVRIEYALSMNHGEPKQPAYAQQFRSLLANLKKNKVLIDRLLKGSLTADELSNMPSKDMASEELMRERAAMKEENDRQAVRITEENGPRVRRTHKGDEVVEDETQPNHNESASTANQVRIREDEGEPASPSRHHTAGSPVQMDRALSMDMTNGPPATNRRTSSQQFDVDTIWSKTGAGSPKQSNAPRPLQLPPRRKSSVQKGNSAENAVKDDADIDRMLRDDNEDDDDDEYSPNDNFGDGIVWRGKLCQTDNEPVVNARFVAGRDLAPTAPWNRLLKDKLIIDGRLQVPKAEEYLCGLQYSTSSDVSVLALTPYDDKPAFDAVFDYFKSRQRYAVVNKDKPALCKDLYVIPVEKGDELPAHVGMLEFCDVTRPVEERLLLATLVVSRAPLNARRESQATPSANGNGAALQHLRQSIAGPAGSPLTSAAPTFSPQATQANQTPVAGYGAPLPSASPLPPNPYASSVPPQQQQQQQQPPSQRQAPTNSLAAEILGPLYWTPTAQAVLGAEADIPRDKVEHLKRLLEQNPAAQTDVQKLTEILPPSGR